MISARRVGGIALTIVLLSVLTACSASVPWRGGQSAVETTDRIANVPGLEATVSNGSRVNGLGRDWQTQITVTVNRGYEIADVDRFTDWLIKTGWSVRDHRQNVRMIVSVEFPGFEDGKDWGGVSSAKKQGFVVDTTELYNRSVLFLDLAGLEQKLGRWPGAVPKVPKGMIKRIDEG